MMKTEVPLVDVNSESSTVRATLNDWISSTISHYGIDGLRLDGKTSPCSHNEWIARDLLSTFAQPLNICPLMLLRISVRLPESCAWERSLLPSLSKLNRWIHRLG
jgi:hypothetical protein